MFWNDLVRRWRRETKLNSPRLLRAAGGHVAVLPTPQRARQVRPLLMVLVILGLVLLLWSRSATGGEVTNTAEPTQPASVLRSAQPADASRYVGQPKHVDPAALNRQRPRGLRLAALVLTRLHTGQPTAPTWHRILISHELGFPFARISSGF